MFGMPPSPRRVTNENRAQHTWWIRGTPSLTDEYDSSVGVTMGTVYGGMPDRLR